MSSLLARTRTIRASLTAAAASALVPALLLGTTGPAVAATNTLTLTAINRSGLKVAAAATAVNLDTSSEYRVRAGTKRKLPKGKYAILIAITDSGSATLGGKTVTVSGASKLTIDARRGKAVKLGLSPTVSGYAYSITAEICSLTAGANSEVGASGGDFATLYAIPTASTKIAFAAMGSWTQVSTLAKHYGVLNRTVGVPSNPSRTFSQASLGTVTVDSRRGPSGSNSADLAIQPQTGGCGNNMYTGLSYSDQPGTSKIHLSPGTWHIDSSAYGHANNGEGSYLSSFYAERKVAAKKSYFVRFYGATWGPGVILPMIVRGEVFYGLDNMFEDPAFNDVVGSWGSEAGEKAKATLKFGDKTVKTALDRGATQYPNLEYRVKKAGWYTLTNTATRYRAGYTYPSGMLSTASTVTHRFYAKPSSNTMIQSYAVQQIPAGLDGYNRADAGSSTDVALRLTRYRAYDDVPRGANPKLKSLATKASFDGGRTWRAVPVKKIGGVWTAVVPNPDSGAVSLRTRATYTSGGYTEVTVYRAYAIG
ncbi:hypothetical protein FHR83_005891 [Actinoplanes campanulatus]|uniref:Uncharacterized protein n=1 Tax=Actinoplanes campanulatus TaxID=113559 RepID=A0A7W5ALA3_9ACTN|nr:hypothetical protein [Actinoplanes campanulatus]MBB3098196.1 hypothetical protein [Actinoplanes campanulatus]GGN35008.1 hypothetical protein GCM10010109_58600 [Actinoplanes campanulatus]GID38845.1 hypothetical protein Aca09nite_53510 [Actinoplanes campanulatus]